MRELNFRPDACVNAINPDTAIYSGNKLESCKDVSQEARPPSVASAGKRKRPALE